jgi:hypothetical protein
VLRWAAADTAVGWKGCTKKLSASSLIPTPLAESGVFFFARETEEGYGYR